MVPLQSHVPLHKRRVASYVRQRQASQPTAAQRCCGRAPSRCPVAASRRGRCALLRLPRRSHRLRASRRINPRFPPAVLPISLKSCPAPRRAQRSGAAAPRARECNHYTYSVIQAAGPLRQGGWRRRLLLLEEQEELLSLAAVGLPSSNIYERLAQRSALLLTSSRSRRRWRQPPQRQGRRGSASQASAACWLAPASGAARCCYPCHQAATYLRQCSQSQS